MLSQAFQVGEDRNEFGAGLITERLGCTFQVHPAVRVRAPIVGMLVWKASPLSIAAILTTGRLF